MTPVDIGLVLFRILAPVNGIHLKNVLLTAIFFFF